MSRKLWMLVIAATFALPSLAAAQQRSDPDLKPESRSEVGRTRAESNAERGQGNRGTGANRTIAECLAISNQEEIALAKLAVANAENSKVKDLAEMMIKDHQQFLDQLKAYGGDKVALRGAGGAERQDPAGTTVPSANQPERPRAEGQQPGAGPKPSKEIGQPGTQTADRLLGKGQTAEIPSERTGGRQQEGLNLIDVKRQAAEKCIESAEQKWNEKRGAEGDKCFVIQQVVMHQQMLDNLEVLRRYATPEFQQVIEKGVSATQMHLEHAEQLAKQLDSTSNRREPGPDATN